MQHAVVIAGGGPTGMMLAAELALAGVDTVIVERRANRDLAGSRAGGLHSRTIEILDQRGIVDRFLSQGKTHTGAHFHVPLDMSDFPTRHNYLLALWQNYFERILAGWVAELGVPTLCGREVTGFTQDESGVDVALSDGHTLRSEYLVGCDGGRSLIRKAAGIEFAGWEPTTSWLIAEVKWSEEPAWGFRHDSAGLHGIGKLEDRGLARVVLTERQLVSAGAPTLLDVGAALKSVYGTDFGIHSPAWISRFTDVTRQAVAYRERRVFLAGDAAHVHPPMGGQGLNIGMQDAVNLGWKLAQVVKEVSPDSLLDTYHTERHPVAARTLQNTMAAVALRRTDDRTRALGEIVSELFVLDEPRRRLVGRMSGLDVHYELGAHFDSGRIDDRGRTRAPNERHPLVGRRMPDLDIATAEGPTRVFTLLHRARPVLLKLGQRIDIAPWADRVHVVNAQYAGAWELPVLGPVAAPDAALIRPDGHVAWVGDGTQVGLADALTTWFGAPTPA
ncbi:MAG TPA: FAD-dependent monooxygenase [Steroidobacteraceae bacterium]